MANPVLESYSKVLPDTGGAPGDPFQIDKPSGTVEDDLLVLHVHADDAASFSVSGGATWIPLNDQVTEGQHTARTYYKYAGSSEPSSYDVTTGSFSIARGASMYRISGVDPTTPITAYSVSQGSTSAPIAQGVAVTGGEHLLLTVYSADDDDVSATYPSGYTGLFNEAGVAAGDITHGAAWKNNNTTALSTSLIAYWKLDEAANSTVLDAHGSNDLTDFAGNVGAGTGKIGGARDYAGAANSYHYINDNADLSAGDIDFTFSCWIKPDVVTGNRVILAKGWGHATTAENEYVLWLAGNKANFNVRGGTPTAGVESTTSLVAGTWYHIRAWHDSVNNQIGISVNAETPFTTAYSSGVSDGGQAFSIGRSINQSLYFDGLIDEVGFWKRVLTNAEGRALYNSGTGLAYSNFANSYVAGDAAYSLAAAEEWIAWMLAVAPGEATTPVSQSLDARWNVVGRVTSALDCRWNVVATVEQAATFQWHVNNAVEGAADFRWNVVGRVEAALDARWNAVGRVEAALDARWNLIAAIEQALDARWNLTNAVEQALDARWNLIEAIAQALTVEWDIDGKITNSLDVRWNLIAATAQAATIEWNLASAVESALDARWNVVGRVASALDCRWNLIAAVEQSATFAWNLTNAVEQATDVRWNVVGRVASALTCEWDIDGKIVSALDCRWNLIESVEQSATFAWNLTNAVEQALDARWNVVAAVEQGSTLEWDIAATIAAALQLEWDVLAALADVSNALDARWNVVATVEQSATLEWNLASAVEAALDARWNVVGRVASALDARWNIDGNIVSALDARWDLIAAVEQASTLEWNLTNAVEQALDARWNVVQPVNAAVDCRWNVIGLVGGALDARWNIIAALTQSLTLEWSLLESIIYVEQVADLRWNVIQPQSGRLALKWLIDGKAFYVDQERTLSLPLQDRRIIIPLQDRTISIN